MTKTITVDWASIARQARGQLTQAEFAHLLKVSPSAVSAWESGKVIPGVGHRIALQHMAENPRTETVTPTDWIAIVRRARGTLSQIEFGKILYVSQVVISKWETGERIPPKWHHGKLIAMASENPPLLIWEQWRQVLGDLSEKLPNPELVRRLGCSPASLFYWKKGSTTPSIRYQSKLIRLWEEVCQKP